MSDPFIIDNQNKMRLLLPLALLSVSLSVIGGCSSQIAPEVVQSAQSALDSAKEMIGSSEPTDIIPLLDQAIMEPGLDSDQYVEAVLLRARCYAETGEIEKAQADLQEAEMGDPGQALLHFTKAIVLDKEGKAKESKKAFAIAKRLDSNLKMPR